MQTDWKSLSDGGKRVLPVLVLLLLAHPLPSLAQTRSLESVDPSRYRLIEEEREFDSFRQREQRRAARAEFERRQNPGPGLPSLEQQQLDREAAVQDAYDRQRAARIGRNYPPAGGRPQPRPGQLR